MRCPNASCRAAFEVKDGVPADKEAPPPPAPAASRQESDQSSKQYQVGCIGDMVPFLASEAAGEEPSASVPAPPPAPPQPAPVAAVPASPPAPDWSRSPPPVRKPESQPPPRPGAEIPAKPPPSPAPPLPPAPPTEEVLPSAPPQADQVRQVSFEAAPPPPVRAKSKGTNDTLPAIPGELPPPANEPKKPDAPKKVKKDVPSTVQRPVAPPAESVPAPVEKPAGAWEPPPVRRPAPDTGVMQLPDIHVPETSTTIEAPSGRNRSRWLIVAVLLLIGGVAAYVVSQMMTEAGEREKQMVKAARELYGKREYVTAQKAYADLAKDYPESSAWPEYEFFRDLCAVRAQVGDLTIPPEEPLEKLRKVTVDHKEVALRYKPDIWDTYMTLLERFMQIASDRAGPLEAYTKVFQKLAPQAFDQVQQDLEKIKQVYEEAQKFNPGAVPLPERLKEDDQKVGEILAKAQAVRKAEEDLENFGPPTIPKVREKRAELAANGLSQIPRLERKLAELERQAVKVAYHPRTNPPASDRVPALLAAPAKPPAGNVVFAQARGILYALTEKDGHLVWATRVGVDAPFLPVRLPATQADRKDVLILSADSNTLTARNVLTGENRWHHHLGKPAVGPPMILGNRAYIPTSDGHKGWIQEIEILGGHLIGEFELSVPLSVGGAIQQGTHLLFQPADEGYVFVLDINPRTASDKRWLATLPTGHSSRSLLTRPLLINTETASEATPAGSLPGYLVLAQSTGLDAMKLRAFPLPLPKDVRSYPPVAEQSLRGWSYFKLHGDPEKIVVATDRGILGLFGVNQPRNNDKPLFPLAGGEITLAGEESADGLAQVVQVADRDIWVLARGTLQHLRLGLDASQGQVARPAASKPLLLGAPLHAAQASEDGLLFLTTHSRHACLATAVDAGTAEVRWQRQLGLLFQGDLVLQGQAVLALDKAGKLHTYDPAAHKGQATATWIIPEDNGPLKTARPDWQPDEFIVPPFFLPGPDDKTVLVLACWNKMTQCQLLVRKHEAGKPVQEFTFDLRSPLAGIPGVGKDYLILPLADGTLAKQALKQGERSRGTPHWRSAHADAGVSGHVVHLEGDDFLYTDGSDNLHLLSWTPAKMRKTGEIKLPARLVAPPLLLPRADAKARQRVCVADSAGGITLLNAAPLEAVRHWDLGGKITAGPFLRGQSIACIVDHRHLLLFDPDKPALLWKYTAAEAIVGQPHLAGGQIVVADRAGLFVGLDPATGKPRGPGYHLKGSVSPAAAPIPFGADRVFAPLTDGVILLLPVKSLETPAFKPAAW